MPTIIADDAGRLTLEGLTDEEAALVADLLGTGLSINCGIPDPREYVKLEAAAKNTHFTTQVSALWHNDVTVGPGKRSVVQMQGCPIRCPGCYVKHTHDLKGGTAVETRWIIDQLTRKDIARDGVTILGGEPFAQIDRLETIVKNIRVRWHSHIVVYTGFTLEYLCKQFKYSAEVILRDIDILIDGPYRKALGEGAGEWRGSRNQRVIEHPLAWAKAHGLLW